MSVHFGISRRGIQRDCRLLDQRFLEAQVTNVAHRRSIEAQKLALVEEEAWTAWDKSKEDAEVRTQKIRKAEPGAEGSPVEASIRTEGQSGDPAYLRLVLETVRDRRKLLGTDRPDRLDVRDVTNYTDEELDAEIERLERLEADARAQGGPPAGAGPETPGEETDPGTGPTP